MKIANWNVEWTNRWFTGNSELDHLCTRVAAAIRELALEVLTRRHGFVDRVAKENNWTAELFDFVVAEQRRILLDHILVSPALVWAGQPQPAVTGDIAHDISTSTPAPTPRGASSCRAAIGRNG